MSGRLQRAEAPREAPPMARQDLEAVETKAEVRGDAALAGRGPGIAPAGTRGGAGFAGLGAGRPLAPGLAGRLSRGLGLDLSDLRVHCGGRAAETAAAMGATAAIAGRDVVMGEAAPAQGTPAEARLLAHEAAHAAQHAARPGLPGVLRQEGAEEAASGIGAAPPEAAFALGRGLGTEDHAVTFAFDRADLTPAAWAALQSIAATATGPVTVDLYGYASTEGSGAYNLNLSAHRAVAVRQALAPLLPPGSDLRVHAHGEIAAFDPPDANRRVGIDVSERSGDATPAHVPGLPPPAPEVSPGAAGAGLGPADRPAPPAAGPAPTEDISDAEAPGPMLPRRFRIAFDTPLTLESELARDVFGTTPPARPGGGIDYLPFARIAAFRGLHLPDVANRGELEQAYALHRRLYPWIPERAEEMGFTDAFTQPDRFLLSLAVGAMTAQAATERSFDAYTAREHPGILERMERDAQIDRMQRGEPEPFVIPPITLIELEFDLGLFLTRPR